MPELKLYLSERNKEMNDKVRDYLETFWLEYEEKTTEYERPKLQIEQNENQEVYRGIMEIKEGLEELELDEFERRF